jgi:glc operon protein GlcG
MANCSIEHNQAQELLNAAVSAAKKQNLAVAITIVDLGGHPVVFGRLDGVSYSANDGSRRKAVAACNFQMPTHVLFEMAQADPLMGEALRSNPDIFIFPGGMPIIHEGKCVGGLGVSGSSYLQDQSIAEIAVA